MPGRLAGIISFIAIFDYFVYGVPVRYG